MNNKSPFRHHLGAAAIALVLACGTPHVAVADDTGVSMKGFKPVEIAAASATSDNVINLPVPFMTGHPEGLEGRPSLDLSIRKHEDRLIVDLKLEGYLDDSVFGEHYRGSIVQTANGWKLLELGVKPQCYRGISTDGKCL